MQSPKCNSLEVLRLMSEAEVEATRSECQQIVFLSHAPKFKRNGEVIPLVSFIFCSGKIIEFFLAGHGVPDPVAFTERTISPRLKAEKRKQLLILPDIECFCTNE